MQMKARNVNWELIHKLSNGQLMLTDTASFSRRKCAILSVSGTGKNPEAQMKALRLLVPLVLASRRAEILTFKLECEAIEILFSN